MLSRLKPLLRPFLLLTLFLPALALAQSQALRFTTLDIGQGDSAVLIAPGGCVALFDGGPTGSGATIKAYLKDLGVTRIHMAFVSHLHADHMGGIDEVDVGTDAVPIDAVYDHGGTYSSTAYTEYNSHFSGKRVTVRRGDIFSLCSQVRLEVMAAAGNGANVTDENAKSVVVKVSYGAFDAVVGGDLTGSTEDMETGLATAVGPIELYKVHHHGSRYSSNNAFLDATRPTVSFISVGKDNTYGHPTAECLDRLRAHGSAIWQTEDPATNTRRGHIELSSSDGNTFVVAQGTQSVNYASKTPDTTAPTAPGSLVASAVSTTEIDLSWTASTDNVGVKDYRVYRGTDGVTFSLAGTSTTTGFADLGLTAGTTYSYRVTAVDAAGNESSPSSASATTPATGSITVTSPNGGESWSGGGTYNITWSSSGISNVKLEYTPDNGTTWSVIASSVAASTGSYAWTVPNSSTTAARVRASDAHGTASDISNGTFTLTASGPAKVILNEMLANEPGSDTGGEFVELVNVGGQSIDISGWVLHDATGARHTFASGTVLGAGKALVVFASASAIPSGLTNAVAASTGTLSLNNGGDTVTVKTSSAKNAATVDAYTYGSALAGTDGVSMNRGPDASATGGFVLHTSLSSLSASAGRRANGNTF
jgi:beta-lactamase superfamily II metal-dependent hydrolase